METNTDLVPFAVKDVNTNGILEYWVSKKSVVCIAELSPAVKKAIEKHKEEEEDSDIVVEFNANTTVLSLDVGIVLYIQEPIHDVVRKLGADVKAFSPIDKPKKKKKNSALPSMNADEKEKLMDELLNRFNNIKNKEDKK